MKSYWETFVWAILLGMGFHLGYGLISLIIWVFASALGRADMPVLR